MCGGTAGTMTRACTPRQLTRMDSSPGIMRQHQIERDLSKQVFAISNTHSVSKYSNLILDGLHHSTMNLNIYLCLDSLYQYVPHLVLVLSCYIFGTGEVYSLGFIGFMFHVLCGVRSSVQMFFNYFFYLFLVATSCLIKILDKGLWPWKA